MCGEKAQERLREVILERRRRPRPLEAEIEARREEIAIRVEELEMLDEMLELDKQALEELAIESRPRVEATAKPTRTTPARTPTKERVSVTEEAARDYMVGEGTFTIPRVAEFFGCSPVTARRLIEAQVEAKKVVKTDELEAPRGGHGRQSHVYRWTGVVGASDPTSRPTHDRPSGPRRNGAPVSSGNSVGRIKDAGIRELVESKRGEGWVPTRTGSGHIALRKEGVGTVTVGNTPSDHRATKNARAQLKRLDREAELVPA
jgi:hypothetical protein